MPKSTNANETIIGEATSTGKSLRTTIPAFIISQFNLQKGNILKWEIDKENGRNIIKIWPKEK